MRTRTGFALMMLCVAVPACSASATDEIESTDVDAAELRTASGIRFRFERRLESSMLKKVRAGIAADDRKSVCFKKTSSAPVRTIVDEVYNHSRLSDFRDGSLVAGTTPDERWKAVSGSNFSLIELAVANADELYLLREAVDLAASAGTIPDGPAAGQPKFGVYRGTDSVDDVGCAVLGLVDRVEHEALFVRLACVDNNG